MNTLEGNTLIAEFMGWDKWNTGTFETPFEDASYVNGEPNHFCEARHLKFYSSWDWLMPVVEKIESMSYKVHINTGNCEIYSCELFEKDNLIINKYYGDFKNEITTKITAVWLACVDFIKWYNENKKS